MKVKAHAVAAFLLLVPGLQEARLVFEDKFEEKPGEGWSWLRENRDAWRIREGALEIRVGPGAAHNVKNALVRKAPDRSEGRFAIEVTVTALSAPTQQYEQAGITWYADGKPVFKFVKELVDGKRRVVVPGTLVPVESDTVQLRLVVKGDSYTAQYRPDGKGEYRTAGEGRLPAPGEDQVSLQCYHGPADREHWFRFDDFRIWKLPAD